MERGKQRVVLVTGASSGIGRACAEHLARNGFCVYGTSRRADPDPGETVCGSRDGILTLPMDVTSDLSVVLGVESVLNREGRLDVVVNNAGMGVAGPVEFTSLEDAKEQFEVNFFGVLRVCRAVLPVMRRQGGGYIVNIGSIGGVIALPYQALYSASKFALEGLTEALRLEVRRHRIRVVLIQPGDHKTGFTANRRQVQVPDEDQVYAQSFRAALGRMEHDEQSGPEPARVAHLVHGVLLKKHPRLRYTAGLPTQRVAAWLKRVLPYSAMELGLRRYYDLDR